MSVPTAGEVVVRRCVVRVIRRGGWSWGPDPHGLVRRALDALPDLLAAEFDGIVSGDGPDVEITEPVRLTVRLSRRGGGATATGLVPEPTGVRVDPAPVAAPPATPAMSTVDDTLPGAVPAATPAALFTELAERGELRALLALLPDDTLRTCLSALRAEPPAAVPAAVVTEVATELAHRQSFPVDPATHDLAAPASSPPAPVVASPATVLLGMAGETTRVCAALPFLLAGPLARTGYLDAIGPALSSVDLLGDAPLFAAALAYKVLGAPERGWRRTPGDNASAAVFAGLESVPDLTVFARRVRPVLPVLDGVLALSLCRGHDPADALLVTGVDDGVLLVDARGMFPVAWAAEPAGLLPHWAACGRPPVLVCSGALPPSCLRDLAAAGVRFVTDVRPLRDDPVSRLPWRTPLWTAGAVPLRLAAELPVQAENLAGLVDALFTAHRAVPLAEDDALEHTVTLAASLALGMLAWQLWREDGPDPVLALRRFADLEATVEFTPRAVKVRLPLGRRHTDLWRCGALTDVHDVVWLGGRPLTFSGG
ncbi:hypothetical protein [Actinophytocola sp.]|uniref:hypothetical protein n=1 Tax=Actinophytocola sp. TaxID=1872138 RepID=UPI002D33A6EF|nr:hypothetical protein [Actinophytocola sp.]HYQ66539.1 hypothetical protein [Actinophytocola sp.]